MWRQIVNPIRAHLPSLVRRAQSRWRTLGSTGLLLQRLTPWPWSWNPNPPRCLSSLCNLTHREKQPGEQEAAWSQLVGKAKHRGRRERIWNLTSSQLESISATGKWAPSLWDENMETAGSGEGCIRGCLLLLYSKPAATATFYKPSSWNTSKTAPEWMQWDQVLYTPEKEILTITGIFVLSGVTAPTLLQMAQQHLSTATSSS